MSLSEAIAAALKNSSNPVETVADYLAEKDSRVTRAEAARLIWNFERQVGALIECLQRGQPIPPGMETAIVEAAWLQAGGTGRNRSVEALTAELRKRGALLDDGDTQPN